MLRVQERENQLQGHFKHLEQTGKREVRKVTLRT